MKDKKEARDYKVYIKRSKRKTIGIEIREDLSVLVKAPARTSLKEIERILEEKRGWIEKHLASMRQKMDEAKTQPLLTPEELHALADEAIKVIPPKVASYARLLGVTYGRITIRNQKTRWGSCSSIGNLNFNCLLMLAPEEVLDYVIVHELCHRKEMNHSKDYWALVEGILPDYKEKRAWLKEHGSALMHRQSALIN